MIQERDMCFESRYTDEKKRIGKSIAIEWEKRFRAEGIRTYVRTCAKGGQGAQLHRGDNVQFARKPLSWTRNLFKYRAILELYPPTQDIF